MRFRFIPREEHFFEMFVEDAANVLAAARHLEEMLRTYQDVADKAARVGTAAVEAAIRRIKEPSQ